jgi:hypothetical protein
MRGDAMRNELDDLVRDFETRAVPEKGRYVQESAIMDEDGVQYLPPKIATTHPLLIASACLLAVGIGFWGWKQYSKGRLETEVE